MQSLLRKFWSDEQGATAIEYCVIAGLLSIVIVVAATAIGTNLNLKFAAVSNGLN